MEFTDEQVERWAQTSFNVARQFWIERGTDEADTWAWDETAPENREIEREVVRAVATAVLADHEAEMRALRDLLERSWWLIQLGDMAAAGVRSDLMREVNTALQPRPTQAGEEGVTERYAAFTAIQAGICSGCGRSVDALVSSLCDACAAGEEGRGE